MDNIAAGTTIREKTKQKKKDCATTVNEKKVLKGEPENRG